MRRVIGPLVFGVVGVAILISLGTWQLQRLALKEAKIAEIEVMIGGAPVALPAEAEQERYRAVTVSGRLTGEAVYKLDSLRDTGPGKRVIAVMETGGRRVLVDLGIRPEGKEAALGGQVTLTGNLDMPQEKDSYTPPPEGDLWFARDVPAMAAALGTEALLIVADGPVVDGIVPVPVNTSSIPNDHWNYALTWFSLALVWFVMTGAWMWRIRRQNQGAG
ncbi:SURF1 family protein [Stagnihabitans tardus]|uniref:SURF1-like protein n=1 Tax=Stagnihabitans tardus TaxID=2699202 RepID=A0AAE4YBY6_9RHOB|nr:SURF1 family protein [Stagnihabitans tardus]NBZ89773.1 SURF1 family protein [Stagnihabitans tardus]